MVEEEIRRAALERFGIANGQKDYNLDRIVRVAALATGCEYASFCVAEGRHQLHIATHGAEWSTVNNEFSLCRDVIETGGPIFLHSLHARPEFTDHPAVWGELGIRCYAGMPVYAATKAVIGALCVMSPRSRELDTSVNRRLLNDCVRLIEDSLMLRGAAIRDPLTGLYNRRFYRDQVESEWRRAMRLQLPISMLVADIDHFKAFNDSAGHLEGDRVITKVAKIISARIRRAGDTVCRFGGEEFAMILPATGPNEAIDLAESIRAAVQNSAIVNPGHPKIEGGVVTVSIGVTSIGTKADLTHYSSSDLLGIADDALYEAKAAGRNCIRSKQPKSYSKTGE